MGIISRSSDTKVERHLNVLQHLPPHDTDISNKTPHPSPT